MPVIVGGFEQGLAETEKALSLNPNDADVLVIAAAILPMFGKPEQAAELADRAVRINPNYPDWYKFNHDVRATSTGANMTKLSPPRGAT